MHLVALTLAMTLCLAPQLNTSTPQLNPTAPSGSVTLDALRDHARPLLLFAPTPDDPRLRLQLRRLRQGVSDVSERDVVVIAISDNNLSPTSAALSPADTKAARRRFHIAPADFTVILLGKDGGEKLRSASPLTIQKLRDTIDAMPMRQTEMRSRPTPP